MSVLINGTNGLIQAYDYQTPSTGFSYTFAAGTQTLVMNPAATLANGTITMPAAPSDGMTITISTTKQITSLTLNGNTGQTIVGGVNSLAPNQVVAFVYRAAITSWFPMSTQIGQNSGPAFGAYQSSTQSASAGTWTKIQLQTEEFDTANAFDSTTNYRFQPLVAGYYQFNGLVSSGAHAYSVLSLYKNGVIAKQSALNNGPAAYFYTAGPITSILYLNGSTDYVEMYAYFGTTTSTSPGASATYFNGSLVRAA